MAAAVHQTDKAWPMASAGLKSESSDFAEQAWSAMQSKLEAAVDNMKTSPSEIAFVGAHFLSVGHK